MSIKLQLTPKLDQKLVMSQQLRQAITLLHYTSLELKEVVQQAIESNPLLEVEEKYQQDGKATNKSFTQPTASASKKQNTFNKHEQALENYTPPKSLRDHLYEQTLLCHFNDQEQFIAEALIDALDEDGLLRTSIAEIQHTLISLDQPIARTDIEAVLAVLQTFDPLGIAATSPQQALLTQLQAIQPQDQTWQHAMRIISQLDQPQKLNSINYKALHLSKDHYKKALKLIRTLNPKPGSAFQHVTNLIVEPELSVSKNQHDWEVYLTDSLFTNLKVNQEYQRLLKEYKSHESYASMQKELQEAQWLISGINRRNETLVKVAKYIIARQYAFLDHGPSHLKPMVIREVAEATQLHESTISRITTGKYILTPHGTLELKYFFPTGVATDSGVSCSDVTIKERIKDIIASEGPNKVYSDNDIVQLLQASGIRIARRTVTKYREAMKILPSYQRSHRYQSE